MLCEKLNLVILRGLEPKVEIDIIDFLSIRTIQNIELMIQDLINKSEQVK